VADLHDEYLADQAPLALIGHDSSHRSAQGEREARGQPDARDDPRSTGTSSAAGHRQRPIDAFVARCPSIWAARSR
jgi:hypothetical protein